MKRTLYGCLLLFIFIIVFFYSCDNRNSTTPTSSNASAKARSIYRKKNFDSLINVIDKSDSSGLDTYKELLGDTAFVEIYEHSTSYFDDVRNFLSGGHFTNDEAFVVIFAMQNLDIDDYVKLCKTYINLFDRSKIPEELLREVVLHDFVNRGIINRNKDNPNVLAVLNIMLNDKKISKEFKADIKSEWAI